jgi:hypothetical protein
LQIALRSDILGAGRYHGDSRGIVVEIDTWGIELSRGLSITLIVIAVALVVFGFAEHFFFRILIVPHLAPILGVIAVVLAAVGIYGMMSGSKAS